MIKGERITLRGLELEDAEIILQHFNDVEVRRYLNGLTPIAKEEEKEWIRNTWEDRKKGTAFTFGIELTDDQQLIGTCSLFSISRIHRNAELGIAIWNKQYWNKGLGQEALKLLLSYGFNYLNLHSVFLLVHEGNKRAIRAYEKVGFKQAARRRQAVFQNGKYIDLLTMDVLEDEFRSLHPTLKLF
ncbi:MAG: GNAT family N-acetyltransferase [Candidatus Hodarchaeota archaeon]